MSRNYLQSQEFIDQVSRYLEADDRRRTFWVLERDGRYVALAVEPTPEGGTYRIPSWTDDIRDCRHWPTFNHADDVRRGLPHPFWMADVIEHAWISNYGDVQ